MFDYTRVQGLWTFLRAAGTVPNMWNQFNSAGSELCSSLDIVERMRVNVNDDSVNDDSESFAYVVHEQKIPLTASYMLLLHMFTHGVLCCHHTTPLHLSAH